MSRQLEQMREERGRRRDKLIVQAVEYALKSAVEHSGAEYTGFAAKDGGDDCLLVIKGVLAGRNQVAFVGAQDLGSALIKAVNLGKKDGLKWKFDQYAGPS